MNNQGDIKIHSDLSKLNQSKSSPIKMYPGGVHLSRTMGSIEAKTKELGGNHHIVTNDPEIVSFEITPAHDFLVLGSS